ncbi:protein S100-A11 [Crotalus tigris]|uniref:protein S100-A11 n=1 Tax=Crotalus tigris TaxID=88082 RepID=UPI00192F97A0|nr:protein S100-A11 [Crotalus tigris]
MRINNLLERGKVSNMAGLVDSICTIIAVFQKYADRNRDCSSMKRRQMKRLLQNEFGEILENPRDPQIVKLTFQLLDLNGDNLVDFNEFLFLIFEVATACYSVLHPQECLSYNEERHRAVRNEEPRRNGSSRREFREEDRRGEDVHERRGADRIPLQSVEEARRGELSRELQGEEEDRHFERRDCELRDDDRRDRSSQKHLEREPERRHLEPTKQEDIEIPKPRQLKQREEDSLRPSQEHVRRNDIDRREARDPLDRDEEDLYSPIITSRREDRRQQTIVQNTMLKEAGHLMNGENTKMEGGTWKRTMSGGLVPLNPMGLMSAEIRFVTEAQ